MNGINGSSIFEAMSKFCGLPIGLGALPIVIPKARVSSNNFGKFYTTKQASTLQV